MSRSRLHKNLRRLRRDFLADCQRVIAGQEISPWHSVLLSIMANSPRQWRGERWLKMVKEKENYYVIR